MTFLCNTCDEQLPADTGICATCDAHFRALEAATERLNNWQRVCGCRRPLPADRTVCDSCAPYCDH